MRPIVAGLLAVALAAAGVGAAVYFRHIHGNQEREALAALDVRLGPERAAWRQEQDQRMRSDLSPLSRIDYVHLQQAGPEGGSEGGQQLPVGLPADIRSRRNGDVVPVGERYRLLLTGTEQDPAVALYDSQAPARLAYHGLHYYPDDSRYVAQGRLSRYPAPHTVQVEATRGGPKPMQAVGLLRFELQGRPLSMEAYEGPEASSLFLIFKDRTNGQPGQSYGAGRFLYARVLPGDQVIVDFNQAWNPLCAYSAYFHCPLPPRSNWLDVTIPVGEKTYGAH